MQARLRGATTSALPLPNRNNDTWHVCVVCGAPTKFSIACALPGITEGGCVLSPSGRNCWNTGQINCNAARLIVRLAGVSADKLVEFYEEQR